MKRGRYFLQRGLTLIELTVVLLIMIALAGTVLPYVGGVGHSAMCQTTDATLHTVKDAIMGGATGSGYYADLLGQFPRDRYIATQGDSDPSNDVYSYSLHYLFVRDDGKDNDGDTHMPSSDGMTGVDPDDEWRAYTPQTAVGWRGPYLTTGASLDAATVAALDPSFSAVFDSANAATDAFVYIDMRSYDGADADTTPTGAEAAHLIHVLDAWHRPIVLQVPYYDDDGAGPHAADYHPEYARLVSAGPGGGIEPQAAAIDTRIQDQDAGNRGDDRVLFLSLPDPRPGGNVSCDQS